MCLLILYVPRKDVIEISSDRNEGLGDWDSPEYKDTAGSREKKEPEALVFHKIYTEEDMVNFEEGTITIQPDFDPFLLSSDEEGSPNLDNLEELLDFDIDEVPQTETDLPLLVCKMGKGSRNKKKILENIMYFNGVGPSSSIGTPLTQEEAERRELAHRISMRYEMLEEADKVKLDGNIKPEEERAMVKLKGQMLKEKKDPWAFLFPTRMEGRINKNALADTGSDTNTMPYRIYEQLDRDAPIVVGHGLLDTIRGNIDIPNMIFTTFDGLTRQTFRAARSGKNRTAESDSDDEEDYVIKRNEMGTPIYNSRPIGYQNNTNPAENMTLSTLESVINLFRKISVWKKVVSFLGSLPAKLRDVEWKLDYKLCYSNRELATGQWKTEIHLTDPYGNIYMHAFTSRRYDHEAGSFMCQNALENVENHAKKQYFQEFHLEFLEWRGCSGSAPHFLDISTKLIKETSEAYDHEAGSSSAKRSRNIETVEEALLLDVHHEFLEWRGCSREAKSRYYFRTTGYEKIQRNDLWLLSMFEDIHQNRYANVAWVIAKWMKRKGARSQKDSQICCGRFISKIARKRRVLTEEIIRSLSTPVYCRDLNRTTLRELIDSEDRLIPDIPVDDIQRVAA
ncbi:hypothetical protein Tco_1046753 [Tanacetum coccineum]